MPLSRRALTHLKYGLPFGAFIGLGFAYLTYGAETRYKIKRQRESDLFVDELRREFQVTRVKTPEEIYQEDIAGKTFDDWRPIRGPHIGEDNSEYERIVSEQRKQIDQQVAELKKTRLEALKKKKYLQLAKAEADKRQ